MNTRYPVGALSCSRPDARRVADHIEAAVKRTRYPAHATEIERALVEQALAESDVLTPAPYDEARLPDCLIPAAIEERQQALRRAEDAAASTLKERTMDEKDLARLAAPWGPWARALISIGLVAMTLLSTAAVAFLLAPNVDVFLLRGYVDGIMEGEGSEQYSAQIAQWLSLGCTAALLFPQALAVLLSWGRLDQRVKWAFVIADILFSLGFTLVRFGEQITFQNVAVSGFELAVLVVQTLTLIGVAGSLEKDAARSETYRTKAAEAARSAREDGRAYAELAQAREDLDAQLRAMEARTDAGRRCEENRRLAGATAEAAYRIHVSALMSEEAAGAQRAVTALLDEQLQREAEHLRQMSNEAGSPRQKEGRDHV